MIPAERRGSGTARRTGARSRGVPADRVLVLTSPSGVVESLRDAPREAAAGGR